MNVSCGIVILNERNEILMGHSTGNKFMDIPKGLKDEGEDSRDCALRECKEEMSLDLSAEKLLDLGELNYNKQKRLHVFLCRLNSAQVAMSQLLCTSMFECPYSKKMLPEMDSFQWIPLQDLELHTSKSMGRVLKMLHEQGMFNEAQYVSHQSPSP